MRLLSAAARQAVFAPLDDGSLRSEAVVRRVGSAIALGLFGDGEQLPPESELATLLNVSTVTLRDALADLRSRGLVETRRGRTGGTFVRACDGAVSALADARLAELGTIDLRELGDVHGAVAAAAARLAAARASRQQVARLREIVERLATADLVILQRRLDSRFYVEVAACAQSVRLAMLEMDLHVELGQLPWPPACAPHLLDAVVTAHRAVVDAIEVRDEASARTLTEAHIEARTVWSIEVHLRVVSGAAPAPVVVQPPSRQRESAP